MKSKRSSEAVPHDEAMKKLLQTFFAEFIALFKYRKVYQFALLSLYFSGIKHAAPPEDDDSRFTLTN